MKEQASEEETLTKILTSLDPTQESIVTASSTILKMTKAHKQHEVFATKVVQVWQG